MYFRWSKNGRYYLHYSKLHNTIMARSKILLLEYEIWAYVTIIKILLLNVCSICRDRSCSHWLWNLITWYIEACRSCLHANTLIRFSNLETKSCRHIVLTIILILHIKNKYDQSFCLYNTMLRAKGTLFCENT